MYFEIYRLTPSTLLQSNLIYSLLYAFNAFTKPSSDAKFIRGKGNVDDGDESVHGLAFPI